VIGEALCCGLGVITTNVGGIPELVNESNSILLEPADENALTTAMKQVIEKTKKFDRHNISAAAVPKFSFESIGKKIDDVYNRVMSTL
jgi:glycosyltransferase involved in cell wall biosynthesis